MSTHNSDVEERGEEECFGWLGLVEKKSSLLSMLNLKCILVNDQHRQGEQENILESLVHPCKWSLRSGQAPKGGLSSRKR